MLFQNILPWGGFVTSSFVQMQWDRESGETAFVLTKLSLTPILIHIGWIAILCFISALLLKNTGVEEAQRKHTKTASLDVKIHKRPAEFMKLKGSPAWYAFFIVPVIAAIIGTLNYTANIAILTETHLRTLSK